MFEANDWWKQKSNDMKKTIVLLILSVLTLSATVHPKNNELVKELRRKVYVDLSNIELSNSTTDFVMVSFKIKEAGILIQEVSSSNEELENALIKKLYKLKIDSPYNQNQLYNYKFTFEAE